MSSLEDAKCVEILPRHCSGSHRKLDDFRREGKYCDISINVQETTKTCHRAVLASVSEFFDVMFYSTLRESFDDSIVLSEIDALAFESILRFAYLGLEPNFFEPANNVYNILKACDFLRVFDLVEICIRHITKHMPSIRNLCEIFAFACASNYSTLSDVLSSYIAENFYSVSSSEDFLLLPSEQLGTILESYQLRRGSVVGSFVFRDENLLLDALIRWTLYLYQERKNYFLNELLPMVNFDQVSEDYLKFIDSNYRLNLIACEDPKSSLKASIMAETVDILPTDAYKDPTKNTSLHFFVQFVEEQDEDNTFNNVFSINKYQSKCSNVELKNFRCNYGGELMVALDEPNNLLYRLDLERHLFSSYSTITMSNEEKTLLTAPEYCDRCSKMCGFQNKNIYLYNYRNARSKTFYFGVNKIPALPVSCILNYQCETDKWFTVPEMKTRTSMAHIVADDKLVYLIGGNVPNYAACPGYVQGYDCRIPSWTEFSKIDTNNSCFNARYCCHKGKIYASDGKKITMFDPVNQKWKISNCKPNALHLDWLHIDEVVSFENQLWIIYSNDQWGSYEIFTCDPSDPNENWPPYHAFGDSIIDQIESYSDKFAKPPNKKYDTNRYEFETLALHTVVFKPV